MTAQESEQAEPVQLPIAPGTARDATLAELDKLVAFVRGLELSEWSKPSAATPWTVGDVITHLNLALGLYNRLLSTVSKGGGGGSVWKAFGQITKAMAPAAAPAFDAINRELPRVLDRALAPEVRRGQFEASARTFRERLTGLDSKDFTRPVYYIGGPWPLSFFLTWILNEMAIHRWDMTSPRDPGAGLDEPARNMLPWFYWSATPFMLHLPKGTTGSIQVSLPDAGAEMWWRAGDKGVEQGVSRTTQPDVTITGHPSVFVLTLAGRIPADDALEKTPLTATGNTDLAKAFLRGWRIL
jgi:uncharacterized protein (TIGR03083 family)